MYNIKELFRTIAMAYYKDENFSTTLIHTVMNRMKEKRLTDAIPDFDVFLCTELADLLNIRLVVHKDMYKTIESAHVFGKNDKETYHIHETENGYSLIASKGGNSPLSRFALPQD